VIVSKKKKKQAQEQQKRSPPLFAVDDRVRVRSGVKDPDNPDIPIGGWCGVVLEVDESSRPPCYLVEWDQRTLEFQPPIFLKRCLRDEFVPEIMWLDENDLERDQGEMLPVEQPTEIITHPLDPEEPDDRLRAVFELTSDDAVPLVSEETLAGYHAFLSGRLPFPFNALTEEESETGPPRIQPLTVLSLLPGEDSDREEGLLCKVQVAGGEGILPLAELIIPSGNKELWDLVNDHGYWFSEFQELPDILSFPGNQEGRGPRGQFRAMLVLLVLLGALVGATIGPIVMTLEGAVTWMTVGGGILAVLLGVSGLRYGAVTGAINRARGGAVVGILVGLLVGVVVGAVLGALALAYVGTIAGGIVGAILARALTSGGSPAPVWGGVVGTFLGGALLAFYTNAAQALVGLGLGAAIGAGGAVLFGLLMAFLLGFLLVRRP
jgi:Calcium binding